MIKVAPAGEIRDVLVHLSTLSGGEDNISQNPDILSALRKWYETHKFHIPLPEGKVGLVTSQGYCGGEAEDQSQFTYYDGVLKVSFAFNPFNPDLGWIVSDAPLEIPTGSMREGLLEAADAYKVKSFKAGKMLYAVNQ